MRQLIRQQERALDCDKIRVNLTTTSNYTRNTPNHISTTFFQENWSIKSLLRPMFPFVPLFTCSRFAAGICKSTPWMAHWSTISWGTTVISCRTSGASTNWAIIPRITCQSIWRWLFINTILLEYTETKCQDCRKWTAISRTPRQTRERRPVAPHSRCMGKWQ